MSFDITRLYNRGINYIGDVDYIFSNQRYKTFVVVGVARGGTSLISGTLSVLGIFTGDKSCPPVYEDLRLAEFMEKKDYGGVRSVIEDYNNRHDVWGFKRPAIIHYLQDMHKFWRNPIYLFVFKDIASIANRNHLSMGGDFFNYLVHANASYNLIINFMKNNAESIHGVCFSYEKVMANNSFYADFMCQLVGVSGDGNRQLKDKVLKFIERDPEYYLKKSQILYDID